MLMESVSIKNLDLNFGSVEVLKNLNLDVHQGNLSFFLGPLAVASQLCLIASPVFWMCLTARSL